VLGRVLRRGMPLTRYRVQAIRELRFDCSRAERDLEWTAQMEAQRNSVPTFAAREV